MLNDESRNHVIFKSLQGLSSVSYGYGKTIEDCVLSILYQYHGWSSDDRKRTDEEKEYIFEIAQSVKVLLPRLGFEVK